MWSSEGLFLWGSLVFLLSRHCCAYFVNSGESLAQSQTQREAQNSLLLFNRTQRSEPVPYHLSHKLKVYQLRKPQQQQDSNSQALADPWWSESGKPTSEQQGREQTALAQELLESLIPGPDLNPPLEPESEVQVKSEMWIPIPAQSVTVHCDEETAVVEVKQDFLGNGQLVNPPDLTLGGCTVLFIEDAVLHFRTDLQGCNSTKAMTEEALIYSFSLLYEPKAIGSTAILKTNAARMVVECQYPRRQYTSSGAMKPTWSTFALGMWAEQQLHFSLRLMTEDWQWPRPSSVYFLSDVIHVEAAVVGGSHIPLRVFVDDCVATLSPNPDSTPRYQFITNYGCLSDSMLTGSKSYFMPRSHEDKLHFQLKAFKFHQDDRNLLYITCHLKATSLSTPVNSQNKACSFLTDRWVASGGDNMVCSCCKTRCDQHGRRKRQTASFAHQVELEGMVSLGPITLEESVMEVELPSPVHLRQTQESRPADEATRFTSKLKQNLSSGSSMQLTGQMPLVFPVSYWSMALLCGTSVATAALILTVAAFCHKTQKMDGHDVPT